MNEKSIMRKKYAQIRNSIPEDIRNTASKSITEKVLNTDAYKYANTVFLYMSFGSEVDTLSLAESILNDGKTLAVPLCDISTHEMSAVSISSLDMLKTGAYGIPEPDPALINDGTAKVILKEDIDVIIVPALAFDRQKFRLGYGGGYYDRFLNGFSGISIGIAYSECIADSLPYETYDCAVDILITPEEMI